MELTLKISDNWMDLLKIVGGFLLFCAVTIYGGRHYLRKQKRDAEQAQRLMDEMNQANAQDEDNQE